MINLEQIKNKHQMPFAVPQGYLEGLESQILLQAKRRQFMQLTLTRLTSLAAAIILGFFASAHFSSVSNLDDILREASSEQIFAMMEIVEIENLTPFDL